MTRRQRRGHLILWIILVPALAFALALSLSIQSEKDDPLPGPHSATSVEEGLS